MAAQDIQYIIDKNIMFFQYIIEVMFGSR